MFNYTNNVFVFFIYFILPLSPHLSLIKTNEQSQGFS